MNQKPRTSDLAKAFAALLIATALGCAKSSDGGGAPVGQPLPQSCAPNTPCNILPPSNVGFYAESASMKQGGWNTNNSILNPTNNYSAFLRDAMGVCDREYYTGGLSACTSWINGYHDIVFMMDTVNSNAVRVIVRAYPANNSQFSYQYQLPHWSQFLIGLVGFPMVSNPQGFFNPMILNATIYPVNQSQGFEIRAYGPAQSPGYNNLLQLQVPVGKTQDTQFNFVLSWSGQQIATGTMVRCQTQNCGL